MTTMTIALVDTNDRDPYYAGRADAYDDSATLTIEALNARARLYSDLHPDFMYVMGYADRVVEIRMENAAVVAAETELAHTDVAGAR
ncbi:hypothetical protein [Streptomyces sp. NBC_00842]|uniref:hypothetical protein n=1 Tax=Streptomyces sp. NBC_00842 TaxID=2975848 RepID=UPI002F9080E4|nr:hypothetical protein OH821_45355 [Streptomyces sp. NBC_00842]